MENNTDILSAIEYFRNNKESSDICTQYGKVLAAELGKIYKTEARKVLMDKVELIGKTLFLKKYKREIGNYTEHLLMNYGGGIYWQPWFHAGDTMMIVEEMNKKGFVFLLHSDGKVEFASSLTPNKTKISAFKDKDWKVNVITAVFEYIQSCINLN